jgi:hypothetical protein
MRATTEESKTDEMYSLTAALDSGVHLGGGRGSKDERCGLGKVQRD